jgi:hypothetical protein
MKGSLLKIDQGTFAVKFKSIYASSLVPIHCGGRPGSRAELSQGVQNTLQKLGCVSVVYFFGTRLLYMHPSKRAQDRNLKLPSPEYPWTCSGDLPAIL